MMDIVTPYISKYGYWAIFFGILVENFGIPLPGKILVIVGSIFAAKGVFDLSTVLILSVGAAFIGSNIGYLIGYYGGRTLLLKYGKNFFIDEVRLAKLEVFVARHGFKIVPVARFITGVRQTCGLIMGTTKMPVRMFMALNMLGALLWVGVWGFGTYYLGRRFDDIFTRLFYVQIYFVIALAVIGLWFILFKWKKPTTT